MLPFAALVALLALNVLAMRDVRRMGDRVHAPRARIVWIWILPFLGGLSSLIENAAIRRSQPTAESASGEREQNAAPEQVHVPGAAPFELRSRLVSANGFVLVDWRAAGAWLATIADESARAGARVDLHRAWLSHLCECSHEGFRVHESDDVMILSSLEPDAVRALGRHVTMTRKRVAQLLGALASFPPGLKSVVLVLDDEEAYYRYVSIYYPGGGEFALSGGMFIDAGCAHFVVRRAELRAIEPTIAHELTHSALAHLKLPRWLDEGLAVNTEHKLAGASRGPFTPRQLHERQRAFWTDERIQEFWSGESFFRNDDGNLLSYELARIMVAQMGRSWPAFEQFAKHAQREDSGAAAARDHMSLDLGAYASLIVEREPSEAWAPAIVKDDQASPVSIDARMA